MRQQLLEELGPAQTLYKKGTNPYLYVDLFQWEEPHLVMIRLNQLPETKAQVYAG